MMVASPDISPIRARVRSRDSAKYWGQDTVTGAMHGCEDAVAGWVR